LKDIYQFNNGFNRVAIIAFVVGIFPNVPGFHTAIHVVQADFFPQ